MSKYLRIRNLPVLLYTIPGLLLFFTFYSGLLPDVDKMLIAWPGTLGSFALFLGAASLLRYHATKVLRRDKMWSQSMVTLIMFAFTFAMAYLNQSIFDWLVTNVKAVWDVAMCAYVGWYNLTLFYRATRVRNVEVGFLIASCVLVILWNAPFGPMVPTSISNIGSWINKVPNNGVMRGINICLFVGMIGLWFRSALGYERSYSGGTD